MHPFACFDFPRKPPLSPLDELLQIELAEALENKTHTGCFVPLPAQTGIGKTHSAAALMLERMLARIEAELTGEERPGPVSYMTSTVDNVQSAFRLLQLLIETQTLDDKPRFTNDQQAYLLSRIIYLPAQSEQMLTMQHDDVEILFDAFDLWQLPQLTKDWKSLQNLSSHLDEHPRLKAEMREELHSRAGQLFHRIVDGIQRQNRQNEVCLNHRQQQAVDRLLPGDKVRRQCADALFMTTHKFFNGYQSTRHRIYPLRKLAGQLLIIDEIDRQNEVMLDLMCKQQVRDLINVTRTLSANLSRHRIEDSPRYTDVEELFEPLSQQLKAFEAHWQTAFSFNVSGDSLGDKPVRLFSDRTLTHVNSHTHRLFLESDASKRKNLIVSHDRELATEDGAYLDRLTRFVNEADWIYRGFLTSMRKAVWLILRNTTHQAPGIDGAFQEAVLSLLAQLNLSQFAEDVFASFDSQIPTRVSKPDQQLRMAQRSYHDSGLKMIDIARAPGVADSVGCHFHGLTVSPTGLLARMVDAGAAILGISATAASETVIGNFDQQYLRTRLGQGYRQLTPNEQMRIHDYYRSRRNYTAAGVEVNTQSLRHSQACIQKFLGSSSPRPGVILMGLLGKEDFKDNQANLMLERFSKVIQAVEYFATSEHGRYMLVMLPATLKKQQSHGFIEQLERYLAPLSTRPIRIFAGMDAQSMREGQFTALQDHLSSTTDKVVVFSTYASMGEGKNPDYPVGVQADLENLLWVGEGPAPAHATTDIDTLYLAQPTHLLMDDAEEPYRRRLKLLHQVLSLQESGWIAHEEARSWSFQILQGQEQMRNLGHYYRTGDADRAIRRIIEQAVGRTARTAFKRKQIDLLLDQALVAKLADDHRSHHTLSHEYTALRDYCRSAVNSTPELTPNTRQAYNRARLFTLDTLALIRELLNGVREGRCDAIHNWEALRCQLLRHPTLPEPDTRCPKLYLYSPELPYAYQGSLEVDGPTQASNPTDIKLFNQVEKPRWVGEEQSRLAVLMRSPVVRAHFEQQGFARQWLQASYVMTPGAFSNIYLGALGEECVRALLADAGFTITPMPENLYEVFDFIATSPNGVRLAIDAKHWQHSGDASWHRIKAAKLEHHSNIRHVVYINAITLDSPVQTLDHDLKPTLPSEAEVLCLPGLIDNETGASISQHLHQLITWTGEIA